MLSCATSKPPRLLGRDEEQGPRRALHLAMIAAPLPGGGKIEEWLDAHRRARSSRAERRGKAIVHHASRRWGTGDPPPDAGRVASPRCEPGGRPARFAPYSPPATPFRRVRSGTKVTWRRSAWSDCGAPRAPAGGPARRGERDRRDGGDGDPSAVLEASDWRPTPSPGRVWPTEGGAVRLRRARGHAGGVRAGASPTAMVGHQGARAAHRLRSARAARRGR